MEKESALYQKISAFVEELFHTHCDIAAAPDTVRFYAGAVVAGQLSIEDASKQIAELGELQALSERLYQERYGSPKRDVATFSSVSSSSSVNPPTVSLRIIPNRSAEPQPPPYQQPLPTQPQPQRMPSLQSPNNPPPRGGIPTPFVPTAQSGPSAPRSSPMPTWHEPTSSLSPPSSLPSAASCNTTGHTTSPTIPPQRSTQPSNTQPPGGGQATTPSPAPSSAHTKASPPTSTDTAEFKRLFASSFDPNPPGYAPKDASPHTPPTSTTPTTTTPITTPAPTQGAPQSKDGKLDPEVVKQYVSELYRVYAGKQPDPATFSWHVTSILNSNYTLNQAEMSIKFSKEAKEYQKQEAQKKAALVPKLEEYVSELMRVYHKRAPTAEETGYYVDKMLQGTANFQQVEDEIKSILSLPSVPKDD